MTAPETYSGSLPDLWEDDLAVPAPIEVSVVLPCLNEAETLGICIEKAQRALAEFARGGEVVVADNGSTDGSQQIAHRLGARLVEVPVRGYGAALHWGIEAARGEFVIMADSDDSYDLSALRPFIEKLREGYDLVLGNRFRGGIAPGAMPPLHRYFGNPLITSLGGLFFGSPSGDFYCGMRGFRRNVVRAMDLRTTGMEFACEMVVKATTMRLRVAEVPTTLSPDGRSRPPHLRSWRDGWRTLRFFLLFSPRVVFLYPGIALAVLGFVGMLALMPGPLRIGNVVYDTRTLLFCAMAVVLGVQAAISWTVAKIFAIRERILPEDPWFDRVMERLTLEVGLVLGALFFLAGLGAAIAAFTWWGESGFGPFELRGTLRLVIAAVTSMIVGAEGIFGSFLVGIVSLRRR